MEAAKLLKKKPFDKEGRDKLVEASKAILHGTTDILSAYDDSEVRNLVSLCTNAKEALAKLKTVSEVAQLVQIIRPACQSLVDLTAIAKRRVDEIIYPALQARLRDDIDSINRSSNLLISSSKAVVQNPNESSIQARDFCCDRLIDTVTDIETVVQIREWSESAYSELVGVLSDQRNQVYKQLISVMTQVQGRDQASLNNQLDQFVVTSKALVQDCQGMNESISH